MNNQDEFARPPLDKELRERIEKLELVEPGVKTPAAFTRQAE